MPEPQRGDSGVTVTGSVGGLWGVRGSAGAGAGLSWVPAALGDVGPDVGMAVELVWGLWDV